MIGHIVIKGWRKTVFSVDSGAVVVLVGVELEQKDVDYRQLHLLCCLAFSSRTANLETTVHFLIVK